MANDNDPEFREWVESLPEKHWAKYDLSAARLGWDAAKKKYKVATLQQSDENLRPRS